MENIPVNFEDLLGPTLFSQSVEVATSTTLAAKKYTAILFSASWCKPCLMVTPKLKDLYAKVESDLNIVLVGGDRDVESITTYYASMPWLSAQPSPDLFAKVPEALACTSLPSLLIFDSNGTLITKDGVASLMEDPQALHFPWAKKTVISVLADASLVVSQDALVPRIEGKTVAVFFDSFTQEDNYWMQCNGGCEKSPFPINFCEKCPAYKLCNGCLARVGEIHGGDHTFDVVPGVDLAERSQKARETLVGLYSSKPEDFEVLMVSHAKTAEEHAQHVASVPWPVVAFDETHSVAFHLKGFFDIFGDKAELVVLDAERNVVNKDAIISLFKGAAIPFPNHKVGDIVQGNMANGQHQGSKPFMLLCSGKSSKEEQARHESLLEAVSDRLAVPDSDPKMLFFYESSTSEVNRNLRGWGLNMGFACGQQTGVDLLIVDYSVPFIYHYNEEITEDVLVQLSEDFLSGQLKETWFRNRKENMKRAKAAAEAEAEAAAKAEAESQVVVPEAKPQQWKKTVTTTTTTVTTKTKAGDSVTKSTTEKRTVFAIIA
ncbi:hypothetical protein BCR33DRAFT_779695 [Rhizoclosmatium globosum]|uniref:Thioredoxin domain-containing protein n=1 Tax=Rhizoclosmatium globosum TaxID=329046 RepID=A0A1Y2CZF9_9FUNG|nr:hypothetical protein BCR33DRAFT_779695 [Rhizoclosmatium globosum]|eukprot:ORY52380.1 hypothetical protein BCR33DRAFT_779695 [Rhizoclosmatium globosum]